MKPGRHAYSPGILAMREVHSTALQWQARRQRGHSVRPCRCRRR